MKIFAFKELLVGTTLHSSMVSDITNPKMYINPVNTQSMLRVVV